MNAGARHPGAQPPSQSAEPTPADKHLTQVLRDALALVDVQVLDHIVVTRSNAVSMAELGLV